jgi:hypothetical protein
MLREKLKWKPHEARVPKQDTGTDELVLAMKFL